MRNKKCLVILMASVLLALQPLLHAETLEILRPGDTAVLRAANITVIDSAMAAYGREARSASSPGMTLAAEVPPPGLTFHPIPISGPARRGNFENTLFTGSLVSLAALNLADYLTTREALKYPGVGEANPVMALFVKNNWAFAAVKLATTTYFYYSLKKMRGRNKAMAWTMSFIANAVYSWVVYNNLSVIDKMRSR